MLHQRTSTDVLRGLFELADCYWIKGEGGTPTTWQCLDGWKGPVIVRVLSVRVGLLLPLPLPLVKPKNARRTKDYRILQDLFI